MTPRWKDLETYEDWAGALRGLLDEARAALGAGDAAARDRVKRDLIAFVDRSPDWVVRDLDALAGEAVRALGKAAVDEALSDIESRTVDLARLTKEIEAGTQANLQAARAIRLERARSSVDAISRTVGSLRDLTETLRAEAGDEAIRKEIESVVESLQALRTAIENA